MKKSILIWCCIIIAQLVSAQNRQVTGVITAAEDGQPMPGVSVKVADVANSGTISDINGKYSINVPAGKSLSFSFIGYKTQVKDVKGQTVVNVVLSSDEHLLNEVVAIGYGTMKKSDLTGAVTSIKADQLQRTPASGLDQALQGRAAGVTVNANSGQPGAAAEIRIRGIGTVNNSAPIYVVDGIILDNISFLSPNDIESTEILKDASATAIYGSRGANGVILVTTRKGKNGKDVISFNAYWGVQNRWNKLDLMGSKELAETKLKLNSPASEIAYYQNKGFNAWMNVFNVSGSPYYPVIKSDSNPNGIDYSSINTDWQDEVFNSNAMIQNYHLSIDGGNDKSQHSISASYFNQDGTIIGSNYERLTLRINSSYKARTWLKVGEDLSFMNSTGRNAMNNNSSPGASILSAALAMAPWDPTHYAAGSVNSVGKDLSGQISASSNFKNVVNPFSMVENVSPTDKNERWVGDVFVEITPIKGLVWRSALSLDLTNNRSKSFLNAHEYSSYDLAKVNFLSSSMARYSTMTEENTLTYNKQVGKHSFTIMGGQTTEEYNKYSIGGSGSKILNTDESNWYLSKITDEKSKAVSDDVDRNRMFSFLGRIHYSFDSKYMITVNFRADASSKFPENSWGYFPSTALAWRMSEESWMKNIPNLDYLKLRAGWGRIGNDKVGSGSFTYKVNEGSTVFTGYPFGSSQALANGSAILTYVNKNGKWETTEQWNTGVDFGLFKGLLNGNVDLFLRDTKDMLLSVKAPAQVGNRFDPKANVGTVRNQGIEITLDHSSKIGTVKYSVSGNISFVKNELTSLNGGNVVIVDRTICDKGYALYTLWGYQYEGIYRSDAEALKHLYSYTSETISAHAGDAKYKDLNNDGKIDDKDKTDLGNPFPWLTYGLNLSADYKNFDLQLFFQGVYGNEIYNAARLRTEGNGTESTLSTTMRDVWVDYSDNVKANMTARGVDWTKYVNPNGSIPNPNGSPMNKETSSRLVESGAYLRLKNIQLGYTLPQRLTKIIDISRCRFYLSASNLLTFTNYTGYDPEVASGVDYGNYPQARTLMLGVNLDF